MQELIDVWSREEQSWDLLLANHQQEITQVANIYNNNNNENTTTKSKRKTRKSIGGRVTDEDEAFIKLKQYVVELGIILFILFVFSLFSFIFFHFILFYFSFILVNVLTNYYRKTETSFIWCGGICLTYSGQTDLSGQWHSL